MLDSPSDKQMMIAGRARALRILRNMQQKELSQRSGVPLATLRKFEQKGQISLAALTRIAMALGALQDFDKLFEERQTLSISEMESRESSRQRQRVRKTSK